MKRITIAGLLFLLPVMTFAQDCALTFSDLRNTYCYKELALGDIYGWIPSVVVEYSNGSKRKKFVCGQTQVYSWRFGMRPTDKEIAEEFNHKCFTKVVRRYKNRADRDGCTNLAISHEYLDVWRWEITRQRSCRNPKNVRRYGTVWY